MISRRKATVVKCLRHLARQIFEKMITYTTIFCFFRRRRRLRITFTDLSAAPAASYKFIQGIIIIIISPFTLFRAAASRSEGLSFSTGGGGGVKGLTLLLCASSCGSHRFFLDRRRTRLFTNASLAFLSA